MIINKIIDRLDNLLNLYDIQAPKLSIVEKAVLVRLLNKNNPKMEPKDKQWIYKWLVDYRDKWRFDLW